MPDVKLLIHVKYCCVLNLEEAETQEAVALVHEKEVESSSEDTEKEVKMIKILLTEICYQI
jgi:hypothetical protein